MLAQLALFPPNGLDRSLHAAVLIGLVIGTFFTETLGWTYAGLVVPGYLATVFFAAPVTALFIIGESIATYLFVAFIGRWITWTGAWSTAFGRERFYLFIVGAVVVRLVVEGAVVPELAARYDFAHSRELYSIGLVLVPLVANAFWNSGLLRAGPRLSVVTALTALILGALLRFTNLSVSRFQVLNEALSLEFLELPKAHIILVIGALLGARNNVRYGWDYNGILVPGLLAVAWYEPTKLLTTTIEALVVYYLSRTITSVRPFSRMLLVGPRRMLFTYIVGFVVKMAIGFAMARYAPGLQMIDYFGFGYLLPSLLAVKMWNKEHVGIVIMPTLQVSLMAFLVGNAVGYGLVAIGFGGPPAIPSAEVAQPRRTESAALALVLADTGPRPGPRPRAAALVEDTESRRVAYRIAREVMQEGRPSDETLRVAELSSLSVSRDGDGPRPWYIVGARFQDPEETPTAPRAAFRKRTFGPSAGRSEWLVLAAPAEVGSALPAAALHVAEILDAAGVVLLSRHGAVRRHDEAFAAAMIEALGSQVLLIESGGAGAPELSVVGSPVGLPVVAIGEALGAEPVFTFRPAAGERTSSPDLAAGGRGGRAPAEVEPDARLADAPRLRVPVELAEAVGADLLGVPLVLRWPGQVDDELSARMLQLTEVQPGRLRPPSLEELRLFDGVIAPRLLAASTRVEGSAAVQLSAWERAVMGRLGFREVHIGGASGAPEAWGIVEPGPEAGGPERRGNPAWFVLEHPAPRNAEGPLRGGLLVEVPAPRFQIGVFGAGLALADALRAQALIVAGAVPTADPTGAADVRRIDGLHTFFQRWHELWVGGGGNAISIQGIEADRSHDRDVVLSFGREVVRPEHIPAFAAPLVETARDLSLRMGLYDGTREQVPFSGATDVAMSYAKRFAEGRFAIVYLGSALRSFFELRRFSAPGEGETRFEARLLRLGVVPASVDVEARARELASCASRRDVADERCPPRRLPPDACDLAEALEGFRRYAKEWNPYYLRAHLEQSSGRAAGCHVEVVRDTRLGRPWVIAARAGEAQLMPVDGALVAVPSDPLPDAERLRRAIAVGTSALRVVDSSAPAQGARP